MGQMGCPSNVGRVWAYPPSLLLGFILGFVTLLQGFTGGTGRQEQGGGGVVSIPIFFPFHMDDAYPAGREWMGF